MKGYTKLFSSIVTSSIWQEPHETRIVWITLLALADRDGKVEAALPGLANIANVSLEETAKAMKVLMSPDPYSRSKEHKGRRIAVCDGGWQILNHRKYRERLGLDDRREYQRIKQAEYRLQRKAGRGGALKGEVAAGMAERSGHTKGYDHIAAERP